jgi:hypothetical protein
MRLSKIKTDKSDSKLICEYVGQADLKLKRRVVNFGKKSASRSPNAIKNHSWYRG